ncbi:MAG: tyrosine-type recombinase/integrase [Candidatus Micrarchaeota archaeon]|nr:tyrosine-type recombinase/integrase [Candidatus Micrarchaeota archaeon]
METNTYDVRDPVRFLASIRGLTENQLGTLARFDREKSAQGVAPSTRYIYLFCLAKFGRFLRKKYVSATKDDMIDFFNAFNWYKSRSLKVCIKAFYKWLHGGQAYPECVSWLKTHGTEKRKLPEEILTANEVGRLAEATRTPRDRAMLMVLYESGARIGELLALRIKHIEFDRFGALAMLNGKTGMRRVRLIDSVPDLKIWMNHHPLREEPDAHLFVMLKNNMPVRSHSTFLRILDRAKIKAGIKKRIYPHLFRHSRATHLAQDFTEQELKVIFGWSGGSRMPATYVHLSGADIDRKILEKRGILNRNEESQDVAEPLHAKICANCNEKNSPNANFCMVCGSAISSQAALRNTRRDDMMYM